MQREKVPPLVAEGEPLPPFVLFFLNQSTLFFSVSSRMDDGSTLLLACSLHNFTSADGTDGVNPML